MSKKSRVLVMIAVALPLFLAVALADPASLYYSENFLTGQYCDTLVTKAFWNTDAGELSLRPFTLTLMGSIGTPGDTRDVAVVGNYAYTADRYSGLRVIDVADPANPVLAGAYNTAGIANGVAVAGDYAYVADDGTGLIVVDISDPSSPVRVGSYDTPGYAYDAAIAGNYAYVADYDLGGLQVIDIADPANPVLVGSYDTPGSARSVELAGGYAYVADYGSGLQVVDIGDPANPVLAGSYDTPGLAVGVGLSGAYAYVADHTFGIQVIDVSDPSAPVFAGSYDTPDVAWDVAVSGDHLYVADNFSGIHWLDVHDPANPALVFSYDTPYASYAMAVVADHVYLADYGAGLLVFERQFEIDKNVAQSTVIPGASYMTRVKLTPVQTGSIQWEFSADAGAHWQVIPDTQWTVLSYRGSEPKWRATLNYTPGGDLPVCSSLDIEAVLSPVAVLIHAFEARTSESGVVLEWDIEADEQIHGFRIYRGQDGQTAPLALDTGGLIPEAQRQYVDTDVPGGGMVYLYKMAVVREDGSEVMSPTVKVATSALALALHQNHPNPFNPTTTISFDLPAGAHVILSIYDLGGRLIRTLVNEPLETGRSEVIWDGTDGHRNRVSSGVYFYRLSVGKSVLTKKMILLK